MCFNSSDYHSLYILCCSHKTSTITGKRYLGARMLSKPKNSVGEGEKFVCITENGSSHRRFVLVSFSFPLLFRQLLKTKDDVTSQVILRVKGSRGSPNCGGNGRKVVYNQSHPREEKSDFCSLKESSLQNRHQWLQDIFLFLVPFQQNPCFQLILKYGSY